MVLLAAGTQGGHPFEGDEDEPCLLVEAERGGHHFWWDFRNFAVFSHSFLENNGKRWDSGRKNKKDEDGEAPSAAPATKKAKKGGSAVEVHVENLNKLSTEEEKENWWQQEIDGGYECSISMV